jgi:lactate permease
MWSQVYDPFGNPWLSTVMASAPIVVLLGALGVLRMRAHTAALAGLAVALLVAIAAYGMPAGLAVRAATLGAAFGLLPIGWIVLNIIFLYQLTNEHGLFRTLQLSIANVTADRRLQLLLIAFAFGAFFEGAAGFGTPVAVTGAILIGLGFSPLAASGLSLIANTAPVAFGAMGTPVIALAGVTGLPIEDLSAMIGRQLPFFSVLVPLWLIVAFAGWRGAIEVLPAILVTGVAFAVPQYLVSNLHGPWLVDVIAAICSMSALVLFLRVWQPRRLWTATNRAEAGQPMPASSPPGAATSEESGVASITPAQLRAAWLPWIILSVIVFLWALPQSKALLDGLSSFKIPVPGLHLSIERVPPVVAEASAEAAVYSFNWLSATGSGVFAAAVIAGLIMGVGVGALARTYWRTLRLVKHSLLTIAAMLALGYLTRYSGLDATLGLAFAHTGVLYPFFSAMLGWLGVALTGSDTASNVLFGSLQRITAEQLGLSPTLTAASNSSGGVMGKMIDAQSIVVASTATRWYGHEGDILRYVFFHSIALASLVGLLVMLQAYVPPFTQMVVSP